MSFTLAPRIERADRWERRVERERRARLEAERLLEGKALQLFQANQQLQRFANELEVRVEARTEELLVARQRAVELAERDQLTGLANRMCFARILDSAIARSPSSAFALLLIDLDRFKEINDSMGHAAGDALLQEVASRIVRSVDAEAIVARLGGDEFAAVCYGDFDATTLATMAGRIISNVKAGAKYRGRTLTVSCSIGMARFPFDAPHAAADLQRFADIALYRAKNAGRATFAVFDPQMLREVDERQALSEALPSAICLGQIEPWFQSVVDGSSGRTTGVEALVRWRHPERGVLSPGVFLGLVEESGLMDAVFDTMLTQSCATATRWIDAGLIHNLALNVSPSQLRRPTLAGELIARLAAMNFPAHRLTIEITEDVLLHDMSAASQQIEALARAGVKIAIDDFGAGYSNIAYIWKLPIHALKLDRLLTAAVTKEPKARAVLSGIVRIADELSLDVVAEGVETAADAAALSAIGCRFLQGFWFERPISAAEWESKARPEPVRL